MLDPVGIESGNGMGGGDTADFWLYRGYLQNAGDGLHGTAAGLTGFDIEAEYPLEVLCLYAYGCKLLPWMACIPVL